MQNHEFPKEFKIELVGLSPLLIGRVIVLAQMETYCFEIDIVQNESGKIYKHVTTLFNQPDFDDGLNLAVQQVRDYLSHMALKN
jgi:hypothetical protein